jgi:DNA recombination protein RmuC
MNYMLLLLVLVVLALLIFNVMLVYKLLNKKPEEQPEDKSMQLLMQQMHESSRIIDSRIDAIGIQMTQRLMDVSKGMAESMEASKQVFTIADQLQNLEKVLKHQKQRGNLGEASLELILSNILPPTAYRMQHRFKDNAAVDAVIVTKDGMIPVDAKFSLDNYNRVTNATSDTEREELEKEFKSDLKKRIDETAKYIRTSEGTLPFAFMYIPAEGIYYDLLINEVGSVKVNTRNLIDYAYNDKKVIIVSPTTFSAYLQSVLYGFKAFKIEESAQEIIKYVSELQKHLKSYGEYHGKLGKTLETVVNHYNQSNKEFNKIDKDILKITGSSMELDLLKLDKPSADDEL